MKLVLIDWVDSASARDEWTRLAELKEQAGAVHCRSVGWLISEANDSRCIVSSLASFPAGTGPQRARGEMSIPVCSILKTVILMDGNGTALDKGD